MDEVRNKLTKEERAILSDLWENKDLLRSLGSALSHRQLQLATSAARSTTDFNQVMEKRGAMNEHEWLIKFLKDNFKEFKKPTEAA